MRYASFDWNGVRGWGGVEGDVLYPLDGEQGCPATLKAFLPQITAAARPVPRAEARIPLAEVTLLPPIPDPSKILCVASNFPEDGKPAPDYPLVFTRYPESLVGHGQPLLRPAVSERYDYEGEMALIIGKPGRQIPQAEALDHIAGYACFNDGSVRDWQRHSSQFTPGKTFFQSGAFGPWMLTRQAMPDLSEMMLTTRVNDIEKQRISLGRMIFDPAWLVAYMSSFTPLEPGDVIVTGTPSGFGSTRQPPEFLQPGDRVTVEITALGTLENTVVQDHDPRGDVFRKK